MMEESRLPHPLVRACRGEAVRPVPIWLMRQAGRFLPEYREIRQKADFLTICKTPELAAEVTLQPVRRLGVDAAIIFSDILIPLEGLGVGVQFNDAPELEPRVRSREDVARLSVPSGQEGVEFLHEALRRVHESLPAGVSLIGFGGAPFTLATYLIEGGASHTYFETKRMVFKQPGALRDLLEKLTELTIGYLEGQVTGGGAQVLQLFESSGGALSPEDFQEFALPYASRVLKALRGLGVPLIYFPRGAGESLEAIRWAGADVIGIDWQTPMSEACRRLGDGVGVQGNLDPAALLGSREEIRRRVKGILDGVGPNRGFVFNLGHGVLPQTPVENAEYLVRTVRELSSCEG